MDNGKSLSKVTRRVRGRAGIKTPGYLVIRAGMYHQIQLGLWVQILATSLTSCVTLGKLLNLSVLQFSQLEIDN